ncbi:efflux transporter outer membrane subunit [Persicobacter psychrovividus]|uniref:AdeC/adeK/oprM family multidrug efflux complex outer membrane factor n=1 Tax=Persicobacter psychrovividus TaxID=387638 RepID=A0ABM7VIS2_9BACT|nr:adeC/adeK/oprM family multidrug efflux complex outer membrane factor [Persicobacter psychrovividus]
MKAIKPLILFLLVMMVAYGCKLRKPFEGTEMPMPSAFRFDAQQQPQDSVVNIGWWELFDDPQLDTLIATGLGNSYDVRIAVKRLEQAQKTVKIQNAEFLPKFSANGTATRGNSVSGLRFDQLGLGSVNNNFSITGNASWELDFWGKYQSLSEAAKAQYLASEYTLRNIQLQLVSNIAQNYFLLLQEKARLEIATATLNSRDSSLNILRQRFDRGLIPEIDVNQAEIQRAIAATSVPVFKRSVARQENLLSVLLGQAPGEIQVGKLLADQKAQMEIPTGLPSDLLQRRPDILATEQQVIAQHALVGAANANRLPSISLTGLIGGASNELTSLTAGGPLWSVGGGFTAPLFQWGQLKNQADIERLKRDESVLNYEATVLGAFREVEDALITISTLKEEIQARQDNVVAAANAEYLSRERYDKGMTSYLEYLEQQRQYFNARLEYAQTAQQLLSSYVELYKVLGGGWMSQEEQQAAEQAAQQEN